MDNVKRLIIAHIAQCKLQIAICDDTWIKYRGDENAITILSDNRLILHNAVDRLEDLQRLLKLVDELGEIQ